MARQFAAIGRAAHMGTALSKIPSDIETERLERGERTQRMAINQLQFQSAQNQLREQQELRQWMDQTVDLNTSPLMLHLKPEERASTMKFMQQFAGADPSGRVKRVNLVRMKEQMDVNSQMTKQLMEPIINNRKANVIKLHNKWDSLVKKNDPTLGVQIDAALKEYQQANVELMQLESGHDKAIEEANNRVQARQTIDDMKTSGRWNDIPEQLRFMVEFGARQGKVGAEGIWRVYEELVKAQLKPEKIEKWPQTEKDVKAFEQWKQGLKVDFDIIENISNPDEQKKLPKDKPIPPGWRVVKPPVVKIESPLDRIIQEKLKGEEKAPLSDLIHYEVGVNEYYIPKNKKEKFLKRYPNAKELPR